MAWGAPEAESPGRPAGSISLSLGSRQSQGQGRLGFCLAWAGLEFESAMHLRVCLRARVLRGQAIDRWWLAQHKVWGW